MGRWDGWCGFGALRAGKEGGAVDDDLVDGGDNLDETTSI